MNDCNCSIVTSTEMKALLDSEKSEAKEWALAHVESLLTSRDAEMRRRGYSLLEEGINDALFCSCLNYRSLVGGFTHPLLTAVKHAFETWAHAGEASNPGAIPSASPRRSKGGAMAYPKPAVTDPEKVPANGKHPL